MANAFFVPFNFQPVNTGAGNESSTYTVPAGKYARVTVTLCVSAYAGSQSVINNSNDHIDSNSNSNSTSFEIFMNEGEALTFSASPANANDNTGYRTFTLADESLISARIDGTEFSVLRCHAAIQGYQSASTHNIYVYGTADAAFRYEEYNKIS
jgi:hypothetical protein